MIITRIEQENREFEILSPFATKVKETKGRKLPEEPCKLRTEFQRDKDRIIHSKSFRRLMHKTQVFLAPEGDHFRTRLTHTIEVAQIARTISRGLGLNEDLTEAIALGHDLGHTPFGHNGEMVLNEIYKGGFSHNIQSLRVVDVLEEGHVGRGMNLTKEVRDGIRNHSGKDIPFTMEGKVVRLSDRIAYINHDIDDALRSKVITAGQLPRDCIQVLGEKHGQRIDFLVWDVIKNSENKNDIVQSDRAFHLMNKLREFMFINVYHNENVKRASDLSKVKMIIESLYNYYVNHPDELPFNYRNLINEYGVYEMVKDYIAGMTDRYAMNLYDELFIPRPWK